MEKRKNLPIGISDFKEVIESDKYYIDKTMMIKEVIGGSKVILLPRPRRFGKTLNLSMLNYFYNIKENGTEIFKGLKIENEKEIMEKYSGKYPVINMTFKDVKEDNWESCFEKIKGIISSIFIEKKEVIYSNIVEKEDYEIFEKILKKTASQVEYETSMPVLGMYLSKYYGKNPVVLVDEYDVPIQQGYLYGYYKPVIGFMRNFLSAIFKDNSYFEKGVLTGILRVAKESIFSGLNNLDVCTLLSEEFADKFGFTESETEEIIKYYGLQNGFDEIKSWYNGYNFGGTTIYNPWSILMLVSKRGAINPYWVNTSDNSLLKDILARGNDEVKKDMEILISGGIITKEINENIVFNEIEKNSEAVWSFFLFSGYLKYIKMQRIWKDEKIYAELKITNREVKYIFENSVIKWFEDSNISVGSITKTLTMGNLNEFAVMFKEFCLDTFSYFDVTGKNPEKFYHGFVLGILLELRNTYTIKSNKESGYGRFDVMLIPNDKKKRGIIFEFKKYIRDLDDNFEQALKNAMKQIEEKEYERELVTEGVKEIKKIAIAFQGKKVKVMIK